ncbi:hypothetical protein DVH24_012228 [Malus domestica]|uniref:Uncharacterized protein n=1 Tax=Malus domestica TaxID=3750 RepID=A0A498HQJ1_MALDO|nr:hypothetical protein DVH24_012228 [Malus domestica]
MFSLKNKKYKRLWQNVPIFSCDGNTNGTPRVLIEVHTYPIICIMTRGVPLRVLVTLKNLSTTSLDKPHN